MAPQSPPPRRIGAKQKLREFLAAHLGEVLDSETLRAVAGTSEWARRMRELRDEEGMDIVTHNDLDTLKPGQYMLRSTKIGPAFARSISKETRAYILDRNGYTCQMCGVGAGEPSHYDPSKTTRLHIGHIVDKSHGGTDEPSNLQAIRSVCNEGAANITLPRPDASKSKAQLRRSAGLDQLEVLNWLMDKFPDHARQRLPTRDDEA